MGHISRSKSLIVLSLFAFTSLLIYGWKPSTRADSKRPPLEEIIDNIPGWQKNGQASLNSQITSTLKLDDYINAFFSNPHGRVSLYIGYYRSAGKVGAAHSPMVCYPGQGWLLSDGVNKSLIFDRYKISFRQMIATLGPRKELVIYWFQAYDKTSPGTFLQKIHTLLANLKFGRQANAFVRITVPMDNLSAESASAIARTFIESFYPVFLHYMENSP